MTERGRHGKARATRPAGTGGIKFIRCARAPVPRRYSGLCSDVRAAAMVMFGRYQ